MSLIQNMIGILLEICIIFKYSTKRQGLLEENITHICVRHDALRVFIKLFKAILETMLDIYKDKTLHSENNNS